MIITHSFCDLKNPASFQIGNIVQSVYSGLLYKIVEPNKNGMSKLKNIRTGQVEDWNAENNPRFKQLDKGGQVRMYFKN